MEKIQKELVTTLLQAIIEDGKAGIGNAIQDLDIDRLYQENRKIDYAVGELYFLQKDEDGFNSAKSIESCIREMLSFYEDVLNDGLDAEDGFGEGRTTFDFSDNEIKELVNLIEEWYTKQK